MATLSSQCLAPWCQQLCHRGWRPGCGRAQPTRVAPLCKPCSCLTHLEALYFVYIHMMTVMQPVCLRKSEAGGPYSAWVILFNAHCLQTSASYMTQWYSSSQTRLSWLICSQSSWKLVVSTSSQTNACVEVPDSRLMIEKADCSAGVSVPV